MTPAGTKIYFQTRTGSTPWPDASWSDWIGPVWDPLVGMWVYPAPDEIVDGAGGLYPTARYFQYRFWIEDCDGLWKLPGSEYAFSQRVPQAWVSKVVVHFSPRQYPVSLPLLMKAWMPAGQTTTTLGQSSGTLQPAHAESTGMHASTRAP